VSRWHRVDATEIWHFYAGAPLELRVAVDGERVRTALLGPDLDAGERPQAIVPAHAWQTAAPLGAFTLVGATVSPAFTYDGFDLASPGWQPPS
jgi:predicted cupin superfamily sugar epimerase